MDFFREPITQNLTLAFIIGLLSAFPSLAPTAQSLNKAKQEDKKDLKDFYIKADLENKVLFLPIIYGILSIAIFYIVNRFFPSKYKRYWVIGIIIGLIYPTLGWINKLPQEIYGVTNKMKFYLSAQVMYITFYGIIIAFMMSKI